MIVLKRKLMTQALSTNGPNGILSGVKWSYIGYIALSRTRLFPTALRLAVATL